MIRLNAAAIAAAQGQLAGSRSRRRRPLLVSRAGTCSIRKRSVLGSMLAEIAIQGEQPQPGGQVGSNGGDLQPGVIDLVVAGWEAAEPAVLGILDPVLDPGVGAMPRLQEGELPGLGVGGEGLVAPSVGLFEQR